VPKVIDEFTRERVMVSEWIDGVKITQEQELQNMGYSKKAVMQKLIRAFADQIFVTGFVHCDPHPGNVFIRPHPANPRHFQIVILDHWLCLRVSNQFRKQYSLFWKFMFLGEVPSY
jgi:aarF domain-containing kinase